MFIGEYHHTIDEKGRIIIPAKFREDLGDSFIITRGIENCLFVYPLENFKRITDKLSSLPFTKKEKEKIKLLKEILKENEINDKIIYKYNLGLILLAGSIKGLNNKTIEKMYNKLPIKTIKDIKITTQEIQNILNIENKEIGKIIEELENLIISGKIVNTKRNLIKYLIRR